MEGIEHDNDYRDDPYVETRTIEVERLDVILSDAELQPEYVEIMVNVAELEVIRGATQTLRSASPRLLVKGHARDTSTKEPINEVIAGALRDHGYRTVIGAGGRSTVGDIKDWTERAGDVFAWKPR